MTKFSAISDLHLDHYVHSIKDSAIIINFLNNELENNDYLIIAGDLCDGRSLLFDDVVNMINQIKNKHKIIYVPGNHDNWGILPSNLKTITKSMFGYVLDNEFLEIDGIKVFGGTLWFRKTKNTNPIEKGFWPDYVYCSNIDDIFKGHENFIKGVATSSVDVVISHHVPLLTSVAPEFKNARNNDFFVTDLSALVEVVKPKFWIHGHTHNPFNYDYKGTRVLCNPLGYPGERKNTLEPMRFEVIT